MSELRAFTMPKWGIEMTEGVLTQWHVAQNDRFTRGQVLLSVETDKIVNDIDAEYEASCLRILAQADETQPVGALLAVMGDAGTPEAEVDAFIRSFVPAAVVAEDEDEPAAVAAEPPAQAPETYQLNTQLPVSPGAAALAASNGADLSALTGSGGHGRILKQDVEQLISAAGKPTRSTAPVDNTVDFGSHSEAHATPVAKHFAAVNKLDLSGIVGSGKGGRIRLSDLGPGADVVTPFTAVQARIASRLTAAARDIPQFHLEIEVRADAMMALRKSLDSKVSVNQILLKAVADTLMEHPKVNVNVTDGGIKAFAHANVAFAVAVDSGLMTPVIAAADTLSLIELARESVRLIGGVRKGTLQHSDYADGTFTVSNLGMYGVSRFTSIVNPPQGAILSVGSIEQKPMIIDGHVAAGLTMMLTLGCDHRAIDGATGAEFLSGLKARLEQLTPD